MPEHASEHHQDAPSQPKPSQIFFDALFGAYDRQEQAEANRRVAELLVNLAQQAQNAGKHADSKALVALSRHAYNQATSFEQQANQLHQAANQQYNAVFGEEAETSKENES